VSGRAARSDDPGHRSLKFGPVGTCFRRPPPLRSRREQTSS
jgi:hypothetical protein